MIKTDCVKFLVLKTACGAIKREPASENLPLFIEIKLSPTAYRRFNLAGISTKDQEAYYEESLVVPKAINREPILANTCTGAQYETVAQPLPRSQPRTVYGGDPIERPRVNTNTPIISK